MLYFYFKIFPLSNQETLFLFAVSKSESDPIQSITPESVRHTDIESRDRRRILILYVLYIMQYALDIMQ